MADIKTIATELNEISSYKSISGSIADEQSNKSDTDIITYCLLIKKIDELVAEVNALKK